MEDVSGVDWLDADGAATVGGAEGGGAGGGTAERTEGGVGVGCGGPSSSWGSSSSSFIVFDVASTLSVRRGGFA